MNILIISPYYAPFSGVGASRMLSLSKYLRDKGENVTVICLSVDTLKKLDETKSALFTPIPHNINIVPVILPLYGHNSFLNDLDNAKIFKDAIDILLKCFTFDKAIISCGPYYTLSTATYMKKKYGINYILEFRDLGILEEKKPLDLLYAIKRKIYLIYNSIIEKRCVNEARNIIVVSTGDMEKMQNYYKLADNKIEVIYNGYDDKSLQNIEKVTIIDEHMEDNIIYIGYFGKMMYYSKEFATILLRAVNTLREKNINIKIMHIGPKNAEIIDAIEKLHLDRECYVGIGMKDYLDGMTLMKNVNITAIEHIHKTGLGTKIFDYIYLNKPIISLSHPNIPLSDLVNKFDNGFVCETEKQVIQAMEYIIENGIDYLDKGINTEQYSRSVQNEKYYNIIQNKY